MSHNGEINTLRGNSNWMAAREGVVQSELFGDSIDSLFPVVEPETSDSGAFDNVLEFLLMTGCVAGLGDDPGGLAEARADGARKARVLRVPLGEDGTVDGPASIAFTDGVTSVRCSTATACARAGIT